MNKHLHFLRKELDEIRQRGMREKVIVDYRNLMAIIEDYERMDTLYRAEAIFNEPDAMLEQKLDLVIEALFHQRKKDAALVIMNVMHPTLEFLAKIQHKEAIMKKQKASYQ